MVHECFKGDPRKFQGPLKKVSRRFNECVKDILYFLEVPRVFPECFKGASRKFQNQFQGVSKKCHAV